MAAGRYQAGALAQIAALRTLQEGKARLGAERAAGGLRSAEGGQAEAREALAAASAGWQAAVETARFDPLLARHWSGAIEAAHLEAERRADHVREARTVLADARGAWQSATARAEAAGLQARTAVRHARRRDEDRRLDGIEELATARAKRG